VNLYLKKLNPEKAKPFVRRGRKAADLINSKMAELSMDGRLVSSAYLFSWVAFH